MSDSPHGGESPARSWRRRHATHLAAAGLGGAVLVLALIIRHLGLLQFLEFKAYDFLVRNRVKSPDSGPIVLVEMTEADIHSPSLDYPVHDDRFAELLQRLADAGPAVTGIDIWRDLPVPKHGAGLPALNRVLEANPDIVAIFTLAGIRAPAVVHGDPERTAFNDNFPVDVVVDPTIPKVRRTLLMAEVDGTVYESLPFRAASMYLQRRGIVPEAVPEDPEAFRLGKTVFRRLDAGFGAYVGADVAGWQILLDFRCTNRFRRHSFTDVLEGRIPADDLRDKVVLVGVTSESVMDERVTPVLRDHRGIEVQAQAIHQILRHALDGERPLRSWGDAAEDAWILAWCALGTLAGYRIRSPWRFALAAVLGTAVVAGTAWLAFDSGWWIPAVAPAAAFLPAAGLVTSYVAFHERHQRSQLMQLFSRQVSPDIAEALWEQREEFLAGQRPRSQSLTASVLFTDLEGFTATSEKMEPSELMDWLNEYMEEMANTIMANGGVVEKYIGDAIMAVFGVPIPRTRPGEIAQDASNAVRCAQAMALRLEILNARWKEQGLPACSMRIGIHTGTLVAGSLGSADRQEYTVLGDTVNTASRLESFDKEWRDPDGPPTRCRILISEATHDLIGEGFETLRIGSLALKNKSEPVNVFIVRSGAKAHTAPPSR